MSPTVEAVTQKIQVCDINQCPSKIEQFCDNDLSYKNFEREAIKNLNFTIL
jgi:hypothetical protein